jgi:hypothetical protein
VEAFVNLQPRQRGGLVIAHDEKEQVLRNYNEKIGFLERHQERTGLDLGVSLEHILWYHTLRNELYHSGNGMTPERQHVIGARDSALAIFRVLFSADLSEEIASADKSVQADYEPPATSEREGRLRFLAAYSEFESALTAKLERSGRAPLSELWHDFNSRADVTAEWSEMVYRAITMRNALVHGEDEDISDEQFDTEASGLADLQEAMQHERLTNEATKGNEISARRLAEEAWQAAKDADPSQHGLDLRDVIDLLRLRGFRPKGRDAYRTTYSALGGAQDLFRRIGRARFAWTERAISPEGALSGARLADVAIALIRDAPKPPDGAWHYQKLVQLVSECGLAIRGPDTGRTMYSALVSTRGRQLFSAQGKGMFSIR